MAVVQVNFAIVYRGIAIFEVGPSIPQRFDFRALQDETRLKVLLEVVVEARLSIGTNDLFAGHTMSSRSCHSFSLACVNIDLWTLSGKGRQSRGVGYIAPSR